ncbi:MAG: hypothetical protein HY984_02475 [Candidatus Magasanikbacteria bacterium]|nr:hypothetical protein [Candidatus Magasanikbacteria bacterium]
MKTTRAKLFAALEANPSFGERFFLDYTSRWEAARQRLQEEETVDYKALTPEELIEHLQEIISAAGRQGMGYVVDSLLTIGEDDWFREGVYRYMGKTVTEEELAIMSEPTHRTFVNEARLRVLDLACRRSGGQDITAGVGHIASDYYWVENNYIQPTPKTREQFLAEIAEVADACPAYRTEERRIEDNRARKAACLDRLRASPVTRAFVAFANNGTHIQDCRKQAVLRLNYFIFTYLRELADRCHLDPDLVLHTVPAEWPALQSAPEVAMAQAVKRREGCLVMFTREGYRIFLRSELAGVDLRAFFVDYGEMAEAKGTSACAGVVRARARIIVGSNEGDRLAAGEILITNQTTPDFVPLMKRATAIVTEQGGITSHAAIVSRELGIPCVVGVRDATRIFRDGEMVEVDAGAGVVRKLI